MVPFRMSGQQPMHPAADIAVDVGPKNQMEMVRHQTVSENPHRDLLAGKPHQRYECFVVFFIVIHGRTVIAAINDVITIASDHCSGCSGHSAMLKDQRLRRPVMNLPRIGTFFI